LFFESSQQPTAGHTHPQVDPGIAQRYTVCAALAGWRDVSDLVKMGAFFHFLLASYQVWRAEVAQLGLNRGYYYIKVH
jgi:hypothetical protein